MQVELLRDLINIALNDPDEDSRVGNFWCFVPDYDYCFILFKTIFTDEKIEEVKNEEGIVTRSENGFLVKDSYGNQDTFTIPEIALFIDLWEKAQEVEPNVIYIDKDGTIHQNE